MKKLIPLLFFLFFSNDIFSQNIDIDLLKNFNYHRNDTMDIVFNWISDTVAWFAYCVPVCLVLIGLIKKKKAMQANALYLGASAIIAALISTSLKHSVNRVRPFITYPFIQKLSAGGSPSFPSGHSTDAFALATAVSLAYPKWYVIIPAYLWATAAAYSRMYLGVHYPSDVLAGVIIGTGTSALCFMAKKSITKKRALKRLSDHELNG